MPFCAHVAHATEGQVGGIIVWRTETLQVQEASFGSSRAPRMWWQQISRVLEEPVRSSFQINRDVWTIRGPTDRICGMIIFARGRHAARGILKNPSRHMDAVRPLKCQVRGKLEQCVFKAVQLPHSRSGAGRCLRMKVTGSGFGAHGGREKPKLEVSSRLYSGVPCRRYVGYKEVLYLAMHDRRPSKNQRVHPRAHQEAECDHDGPEVRLVQNRCVLRRRLMRSCTLR